MRFKARRPTSWHTQDWSAVKQTAIPFLPHIASIAPPPITDPNRSQYCRGVTATLQLCCPYRLPDPPLPPRCADRGGTELQSIHSRFAFLQRAFSSSHHVHQFSTLCRLWSSDFYASTDTQLGPSLPALRMFSALITVTLTARCRRCGPLLLRRDQNSSKDTCEQSEAYHHLSGDVMGSQADGKWCLSALEWELRLEI
jgi:hypothetical protein